MCAGIAAASVSNLIKPWKLGSDEFLEEWSMKMIEQAERLRLGTPGDLAYCLNQLREMQDRDR
jgi:hypothetical protein